MFSGTSVATTVKLLTYYPGDVPATGRIISCCLPNMPLLLPWLFAMVLRPQQLLPQLRLDQALEFLLGDKLT